MQLTKDEIREKILGVLREADGKINPSVISQKLNWKKDDIAEICKIWGGVKRFTDILKQITEIQFTENDGGTPYIFLSENDMPQKNEKSAKNPHDRIKALLKILNSGLYEKEEAVRLSLLAAVAGESIFFLGGPGCAKSMIARRISQAFKGEGENSVKYFEYLMNQFSTPEEVFGNISIKALNGELEEINGKEEYRRLTEGFLPKADIAFFDEIWKASPAILNSLLTIINERKFHNGSRVEDVPLKALFSASNELPAKNEGLEALYDRFIVRIYVNSIQNEDEFFQMIEDSSSSELELSDEQKNLLILNSELEEWKKKIDEVSLSESAKNVISAIRKELTIRNEKLSEDEKQNSDFFEVGDRRWKKIARLLKTSAFLNGRTEVDLMDCQLIEYCIWNTENQQTKSREIVEMCIKQNGLDCDTAIDDITESIDEFKEKVDEIWFDKVRKKGEEKIVAVDGKSCYECTRDGTNEIWYVSVNEINKNYYNRNYHTIYDVNKQYRNESSFSKQGDKISCCYNFTVNRNPSKTFLQKKEFSDIAQETLQRNFDKEHYMPIVEKINSEIASLKQQKQEDEIPFKQNLFANQEYNESIAAKLDEAIRDLQDAKVSLDKQHERYFDSALKADFSVGDVILKNGAVYSAEEFESLSEKEDAVAVVCIVGEKTFALGLDEKKLHWNELSEFVLHYGDNLPAEYASDWIVPDKELLNKIWENCEEINESLSTMPKDCSLSAQEYWSSSSNSESAAFYQLFDARGHQDHTTKDHSYAVRVIRKWSK